MIVVAHNWLFHHSYRHAEIIYVILTVSGGIGVLHNLPLPTHTSVLFREGSNEITICDFFLITKKK